MKRSGLGIGLCSGLALVAASCGGDHDPLAGARPLEAWNSNNDPLLLSGRYQRAFQGLPTSGSVTPTPWSDWYWPTQKGGIAYRWRKSETPFTYTMLSAASVRNMSANDIGSLSPAEKFDIYRGKLDFPLVETEKGRTRPTAESWEGICHGWAPASYLFNEPKAIKVKGANGIEVPFGSSDLKALLSYYLAQVTTTSVRFLGTRCNVDFSNASDAARVSSECRDTNAGAFHVVIANQLGLMGQAFVADVTRDLQVWNQPVHGFKSVVKAERQGASPGAAAGTVREVTVQTTMVYTNEIGPNWEPVVGTGGQSNASKTYEYRLELNAAGEIIGGEWISEDRPDFLWTMQQPSFTGEYAALGELYKAATGGVQPTPTPTPRPTVVPPTPTPRPTVVPPTPTPRPTVVPPTPTPRPTVVPPTPTPRPTVVPPTPYPTVVPTPRPTVVPTVVPDPVIDHRAQQWCPPPYQLRKVGNRNGAYCVKDGMVLGPMPDGLTRNCLLGEPGPERMLCSSGNWREDMFLKYRGTDYCAPGSRLDSRIGLCVDSQTGENVFGPFPGEYVAVCREMRGRDCFTNRWDVRIARSAAEE